MSIEENFNKRNSELQQKIKLEIEKVKMGQSKKNMVQLQTILTELQKSNMQKNVILSYPRIIVDSWDYSDQLGMELLKNAATATRVVEVIGDGVVDSAINISLSILKHWIGIYQMKKRNNRYIVFMMMKICKKVM